jgi:hypothetical protein
LGQTLKNIETGTYRMFRDRLLVDCGSPTDPIEVMLNEQMVLAHLNVGQLHYNSEKSSPRQGDREC